MKIIVENSSKPEISFIVYGALMECSCGDRQRKIRIKLTHAVFIKDKEQMNIGDSVPNINIKSFGLCGADSEENRALNDGLNSLLICDSDKKNFAAKVICKPDTDGFWVNNAFDDTIVDKLPALLKTATLKCKKGGTIKFVTDGQDG